MSACAVYPEIHWNLILHLGDALESEDGQKLLEPNRLAALTRLPWFRSGTMPDWLRIRLISGLPSEQERIIRETLAKLLLNAVEGSTTGFHLQIASEHSKTVTALAKPLLFLLAKRESAESPLKDYVFQTFMAQRKQESLAVRAPKAIRSFGSAKQTLDRSGIASAGSTGELSDVEPVEEQAGDFSVPPSSTKVRFFNLITNGASLQRAKSARASMTSPVQAVQRLKAAAI